MTKSKNIREHLTIEQKNEIITFHEVNQTWISKLMSARSLETRKNEYNLKREFYSHNFTSNNLW